MEKISWTNRVRNEKVLHRSEEERSILCAVRRRKGNWIGRMVCGNCLLKHVTERKRDMMGRRARRRKQLLDVLKEKRGYWKLKEETLDCTVCRTGFGGGSGSLVRRTIQ
jgi:protein-arginine kinase activator protein McsA